MVADTSSLAGHELAIANAVRTSGIARSRLFITTTYDRASTNADGQGVDTEFYTHLFKLRMRYVDLLLVGSHRAGSPAHEVWPGMEGLVKNGLVKSIGVKDYGVHDLDELVRLPSLGLKPVVNQIEIDAYGEWPRVGWRVELAGLNSGADRVRQLTNADIRSMSPLMDLHHQHKIVTQSYAVLDPITKQPGGPVHVLAEEIAWKKGWTVDQVLLSWAKQQGLAVVVQVLCACIANSSSDSILIEPSCRLTGPALPPPSKQPNSLPSTPPPAH